MNGTNYVTICLPVRVFLTDYYDSPMLTSAMLGRAGPS